MKPLYIVLLLIILSSITIANPNLAEELTLDINIKSNIELEKESSNSRVEIVKAFLNFYPQESYQQEINYIKTSPNAKQEDNSLLFIWYEPEESTLKYSLNSEVDTNSKRPKINEKVNFPFQTDKLIEYTQPTEMIDSNIQSIKDKASEIVEGEDDTFMAVHKLAEWTRENIRYDLSSVGADAVKKASWVLINKEGVCDEMTNLFIAMTRTLGIPARYVSGMAYTNYEEQNDWGPHAWAEVYFPEFGWVPYDLTYGQFGYTDPTHVIFKYSIDSNEPSTNFEWRSVDTKLTPENLDIEVNLEDQRKIRTPDIEILVTPEIESIGFGSYNLIKATIKNLRDYYVSEYFYISKPEEISIINENRQSIALRPNEQKTLYWLIKLDSELKNDFIYTFPIAIYSQNNISSKTEFKSNSKDIIYSRQEIESKIKEYQEIKEVKKQITLNCSTKKQIISIEKSTSITCKIKNIGNYELKDIQICLNNNCKKTSLLLNEQKDILLEYIPTQVGKKNIIITAKNSDIEEKDTLKITAEDKPELNISNINHPNNISFNQNYQIIISIDKISYSTPKNPTIILDINNFKEEWNIKELDNDRKINLNLKANNLNEGENKIKLKLQYKDSLNNTYTKEKTSTIYLNKLTFIQKIKIFLSKTNLWLNQIFKNIIQ